MFTFGAKKDVKPCAVHFDLTASLKRKPRSYTPYRGKNALSKIMHHTLQHPCYVVIVWKDPLSALSIDNGSFTYTYMCMHCRSFLVHTMHVCFLQRFHALCVWSVLHVLCKLILWVAFIVELCTIVCVLSFTGQFNYWYIHWFKLYRACAKVCILIHHGALLPG